MGHVNSGVCHVTIDVCHISSDWCCVCHVHSDVCHVTSAVMQVYAPALIVGDMIYVSGHVPWKEGGGFIQVTTHITLVVTRYLLV